MVEKKRPMLQIHRLYGENLSGGEVLKAWEAKFLENNERRRKELEKWLRARGMLREKNKETK